MPKTRRNHEDKKYVQVGRVLNVLDNLAEGPLTTTELASVLDISERTTSRFMSAMLRFKWPLLYHRETMSDPLKWDLDLDKLMQRLTDGRKPGHG